MLYILIDSTDGHPRGKTLLYWKCLWWSVAVFLQQGMIYNLCTTIKNNINKK